MRKTDAISAVKKIKEVSKKRKFIQSVEMMVNFVGLDMKKPQNQVNVRVTLPHSTGKGSGKIAVFVKTDAFIDYVKGKADLIVKESEIEIIQQNPGPHSNTRETFTLENKNGKWKIKNKRILGWLRKD